MDLNTADREAPTEEVASRRDTIAAALDAAEAPEPVASTTPDSPVSVASSTPEPIEGVEPAPRTAAEKARDEAGRFAKTGKVVKPGPVVTRKPDLVRGGPAAPGSGATVSGTTPPVPGDQAATLKAPASWKPAARERWSALPAEVQQEALRVDREVQQAMRESVDARRNWTSFQQAVAPYEGMIRAEGGEPVAAIASLLQTAAGLRTAPAPTKARMVADMVRTFGIDIQMLDQALAGQGETATQNPQNQPNGQQFRDPRFDELMTRLQQGERQRSVSEVEDFGAKMEFFPDVRHDMADLIELASRRGRKLSLEDAYTQAVKLNPEISGVMEQREKAKAANATQASTQRARAASASVKSSPSGPAPAPAPSGRRAQLMAAFDEHTER